MISYVRIILPKTGMISYKSQPSTTDFIQEPKFMISYVRIIYYPRQVRQPDVPSCPLCSNASAGKEGGRKVQFFYFFLPARQQKARSMHKLRFSPKAICKVK